MLRRPRQGINSLRKKQGRLKNIKIYDKLKSFCLSCLIWLLLGANLIFIVSILFQILNASGGDRIIQATPAGEKVKRKHRSIQVEVLNGCGKKGAAKKLTEYLRDYKNFDVVDYKNYERWDIPETLVIDRVYINNKYARKIANAIGVKPNQMFHQESPERKVDVTIIIGKDYQDLKAFR